VITRTLNLRHVLGPVFGIAGFAIALAATSNATAQDGAAPSASAPAAGSAAAPAAPAAPAAAPASSTEDESKKKAAPAAASASGEAAPAPAPVPAAAPAAAPATGGTTITIGGSGDPTKKDEPTKPGAGKEEPAPPPNPWRGSLLIFDQSISANTLNKSAQLSYQPSYEWWISPRVSYSVGPVRFTVRQDVFKEFTNVGETTERAEWRYSDTWLQAGYRTTIDSISKKLGASLSATARPGISPESRIASQYLTIGPGGGLSYAIDLGGEKAKAFKSLSVGASLLYQHAFTRCNTACASDSSDFGQQRMNTQGQVVTSKDVRHGTLTGNQLMYMVNMGVDIVEHLDVSATMIWISQFANSTSPATFNGVEVPKAADDTRLRQFSWFLLSATYGITKEFDISVGYWNFNTVVAPDGSYRNPFWSPDTRVFFDVYVHLDQLYEKIVGKDDGHKGKGGGGSGRVF